MCVVGHCILLQLPQMAVAAALTNASGGAVLSSGNVHLSTQARHNEDATRKKRILSQWILKSEFKNLLGQLEDGPHTLGNLPMRPVTPCI